MRCQGSRAGGGFCLSRAGRGACVRVPLPCRRRRGASAWRGGESVYVNGKLYTVSSNLDNCCYDKDAGVWFRNLNAALASGGSVTIMVDNDNVIRGVEVSH